MATGPTLAIALAAVLVVSGCLGGPSPAVVSESPSADASGAPPRPTIVPIPGHETYGFVPYWEMDESIAEHLAAVDLTTLALFSVTHRRDGSLDTDQHGIKRIDGDVGRRLIDEAHARGTRVELVYTSFGAGKNRQFYTEPEAQAQWIEVLVELVERLGFDGVNVDVEALPPEHILDYGAFVGRLRAALRERLPDAQVSVATQANELGAGMAAAAGAAGADRIFLMGYDYRTAGSAPGASAPIDRIDGQEKDLVWSLDRYGALGVPVDRTILGLPLYGVTWPVSGPGFLAPARGRGEPWVPRYNLSVLTHPAFDPTFEPTESVEFYAVPAGGSPLTTPSGSATPGPTDWQAVYYDSPRSLAPKLALADARGLAGAGFWAIGYDRGLPGYADLIARFRAGRLASP